MSLKIALLPGDGVGPEVVAEAVRVLQAVGEQTGKTFSFSTHPIGGVAIDSVGAALPPPADGEIATYTTMFNRAIEGAIRRAPEQWLWMHDRWRTRPRETVTS